MSAVGAARPIYTEPPAWLMEREWPIDSREWKAKWAWEMRTEAGMRIVDIGEALGVSRSMAGELLADPTGERTRVRKRKAIRSCLDCGAPCNFDGAVADAAVRCPGCANRAPSRREAGSVANAHRNRYSDDDLLNAVRRAAGDAPTVTWADYGKFSKAPSNQIIRLRFGSWNAALRAAGLRPGHGRDTYVKTFTRDDCLAAVRLVADERGGIPTYEEYVTAQRPRSQLPSGTTVRNCCGGWIDALKAAGVWQRANPEAVAA